MDSITKLIHQAFEHVDKQFVSGKLGSKFLEFIENEKQKSNIGDDSDPEFALKVQFLRECEQNKDLAWMDRGGYFSLSFWAKNRFESLVSPLVMSSGIYFQYSKFQEHAEAIISQNNFHQPVYVLESPYFKELVPISLDTKKFNWMKNTDFNGLVRDFRDRLMLVYINSEDGVKLHYKGEEDGVKG